MRPVTLNSGFLQADFDALIASRQYFRAEAYTLRLVNQQFAGVTLLYTTHQFDFIVPACDGTGTTHYVANDVQISGLKFKVSSGQNSNPGDPTLNMEVDESTVTFLPKSADDPTGPSTILGVPFMQAVGQGALSKATIQRDRWFFDPNRLNANGLPTPIGGMPMFYGYAASIDSRSRTQLQMKAKSALVLLNIQMPRNLFQPNCLYTVYSTPCGAVKSTFQVAGTVGSSPTRTFIPWTSATSQYGLGEVFFESGPNTNVTATIRAADGTGLYLARALPYLPLAGDMFKAAPGCDRQYAGGCAFFGRQAAFRATPFVPEAQVAL